MVRLWVQSNLYLTDGVFIVIFLRFSLPGALLLGLAGCAPAPHTLTVTGGEPIAYQCANDQKVQVSYFGLSDDSLNFVKLALPNGKDYTLPQVVSASGVRYTDDHEVVWWNKGKEGFVEQRAEDGKWQSLYAECKQQ
ncbi:MliC family protein [Aeromonas rivuli]|jgi:membrane-bound inhibitor of C-type lysozyme|nr:MliC family protein [Aeromonas rivuli]